MKEMQSFLNFFYILDQCYNQCYGKGREDDLPWFLGAICPELWDDGKPIDEAIFDEWLKFSDSKTIDINNIMEKTYLFLEYYELKFGFNFSKAKHLILTTTDKTVAQSAYDKAEVMYQEYKYDN